MKLSFFSFKTRQVRYGGFSAVLTIAVIAGVLLLNLIVQLIAPQFDLTENKLFSLSSQSLQVVQSIAEPVTIYGVWEPGGEDRQIKEIAERYAAQNQYIRFEETDPDINPGLLKQYDRDNQGISKGSIIVAGPKGSKVISRIDMYDVYYNQQEQRSQITGVAIEKRITSALLYVCAGETPKVYEIIGHQERSLELVQKTMEQENYALKQVSLVQSEVPKDAAAVILYNPKTELSPEEAERLSAYLDAGGRMVLLLDFQSSAVKSINQILSGYGVSFDYGITAELDPQYRLNGRSPFEFLPGMKPHPITDPMIAGRTPALLPLPMSIAVSDLRRRTVNAAPFLATSARSFLRRDLDNTAQERLPEDTPGPITVGLAVLDPEYPGDKPQTRIALFSSAMFLELIAQVPGNLDLFMNALTWAADRPETISVGSRSTFVMPMQMNLLTALIIGVAVVILIPLACFILGLATWLKRRHL